MINDYNVLFLSKANKPLYKVIIKTKTLDGYTSLLLKLNVYRPAGGMNLSLSHTLYKNLSFSSIMRLSIKNICVIIWG